MSIFIEEEDVFPVELYVKQVEQGWRLFKSSDIEEGIITIVAYAKGRDFDTFSRILEEATVISHITGKPLVRASKLMKPIILHFFKSWNISKNAQQVPLTDEIIGKMHHTLVRAFARKWMIKTGGNIND